MISTIKNGDIAFIAFSATCILSFFAAAYTDQYLWIAVPFAALFFYYGWQHLKIILFLLLISLPWSVEYSFNKALGTDIPDEPLMILISFLALTNWIYKPLLISSQKWRHPLIFLLLVHIGWLGITVFFSVDLAISLKILVAKGWYITAFVFTPLLVIRTKESIRIASIIFILSILAVTIIILLRHSVYGFTFKDINSAVAPFFRNHVNYSAMLVCSMPVLIAAYLLSKRPGIRMLIAAAILIVVTAVFFSFARGAWMALVTGCAAYWLVKKRLLVYSFFVFLLLVTATVFWLRNNDAYLNFKKDYNTTIFHPDFREHLIATYRFKDVSTIERFNRWIAGIRMIKDNPVMGYGPGTFSSAYKPYAVPAFKTWVSDNKDHSTVHNYFLLTLVEQGIPGLLFFLLLLGVMLFYAQHLYHRTNDVFYKTASLTIASILLMIITVNFLSDLIETDKIGSLFFLCLGLLIVVDTNTCVEEQILEN